MSATSVDTQRTKGQDNKVQNGSLHQKDTVHDNDFEPYLTGQSNQAGGLDEGLHLCELLTLVSRPHGAAQSRCSECSISCAVIHIP
uniref:YTH N6-methyladenosine RNA binding protein F1 n=1 Tax=Pongo abelii TaxID=9601 RepID=A0A8I5TI68_PONAB